MMAYDEGLEARIDEITEGWENYEKKRMFGGICYLRSGNMAFGIWRDSLIVRCGPARHAECLGKRNTKVFDVSGKPMAGWVMVSSEGVDEDPDLEDWLRIGDCFSSSLPRKIKK
jgi:TfoX/Sxy family transcriptional regulator of competence genes